MGIPEFWRRTFVRKDAIQMSPFVRAIRALDRIQLRNDPVGNVEVPTWLPECDLELKGFEFGTYEGEPYLAVIWAPHGSEADGARMGGAAHGKPSEGAQGGSSAAHGTSDTGS